MDSYRRGYPEKYLEVKTPWEEYNHARFTAAELDHAYRQAQTR